MTSPPPTSSSNVPVAPTPLAPSQRRDRAVQHAALSLLVPGLGQLSQRRFGAALLQFGTVTSYVVAVFGLGGHRAAFAALCWNLWSVVDAYRHEDAD